MSSPHRCRHEAGQNFLRDRNAIATIVEIVARTDGPIVEVGAGDGALTLPLQRLNRPLTAIEVDERHAARLARRTAAHTRIVNADFLHYHLPRDLSAAQWAALFASSSPAGRSSRRCTGSSR